MENSSIIQIRYFDWKTKKELFYRLGSSGHTEKETDLICPFDHTPLILRYDDFDMEMCCVNCEENYSFVQSQEEINEEIKKNFLKKEKRLETITNEKRELIAMIARAKIYNLF